jgi:hypothetical protein
VVSELFLSGRIVDLILGLVVIEAVLLLVYHRRTGAGLGFAQLAPNLLSGAALLLAVRFALVEAAWEWVAASLLLALLAHLVDLRQRWSHATTF